MALLLSTPSLSASSQSILTSSTSGSGTACSRTHLIPLSSVRLESLPQLLNHPLHRRPMLCNSACHSQSQHAHSSFHPSRIRTLSIAHASLRRSLPRRQCLPWDTASQLSAFLFRLHGAEPYEHHRAHISCELSGFTCIERGERDF